MLIFDQSSFIKMHVTGRAESMFSADVQANRYDLADEIQGKSVLVVGGAGTIGSSFIRALLPFHPRSLTVVDQSENGLTELTRDLRSTYKQYVPPEFRTYAFDFGGSIFRKLFLESTFDIVACFAAHKHVRSEKDHLAIEAMVRNNVFNTKALLDLALLAQPSHLFSVSTDKAANPVNVMGATKKIMEQVLMAYSNDLRVTSARFANVAFSEGSLLSGFKDRIAKRQPISAPSDVKRYFVSPEESGQLCLLACTLGASSNIFFPKLEENQMLTFSSICDRLLRYMGLEPDQCDSEEEAREKAMLWRPGDQGYPVYFFRSDTTGEKPFEEFYTTRDDVDLDQFDSLGVIKNIARQDKLSVNNMMIELEKIFEVRDVNKEAIVGLIKEYLPEFSHSETGKSLDQRM